jgi:hypothetical protein
MALFFFGMTIPVLQDSENLDDLPVISFESSKDEDDYNGQLQERNLFQSLQHNPSYVSPKVSSLLIKLKDAHHDSTNDFGPPVTRPKSPVEFPTVASSSVSTNGDGVSSTPQVKEMPTSDSVEVAVEHFSSNSASHHSYGVPMIQPCATPSQSSVIHNDDNLDNQQNTSETDNRPDSTPITQSLPLISKKSLETDIAVVREISVSGDFATEKPSTSPNVEMILNLVTPQVVSTEGVGPPERQQGKPPLQSLQRISVSEDSLPSDDFTPAPDDIFAKKMEELRRKMESQNLSTEGVLPPLRQQWRSPLRSLQRISVSGDSLPSDDFIPAPKDTFTQNMEELRRRTELHNLSTEGVRPPERQQWRPTLRSLQRISVSGDSLTSDDLIPAPNDTFTQNMEELRRRTELHNLSTEGVRPPEKQQWRPPFKLQSLQRISVSGGSLPSSDFAPAPNDTFVQKMEELQRRRTELNNLMAQSRTSPETLSSRSTATPKTDLRPQPDTLQEDNLLDVTSLLSYIERKKALQTQLDKALAELRDVQVEIKCLNSENQSQQRSISHLNIALDDAKHEQDNNDKALAELRDVRAENKRLNSENQSQQRSISHLKIALDEAKHEQDNNSTQLDKALAELRDVQAENRLLNSENETQQRSVSHLKIALDEAKHEHDNNSTQLDKALAELRDVQAENRLLNSENESQQRSVSHLKIALDEAKHEHDNNSTQLDKALAELRDVQAENKHLNSENESQQRLISHLIALDETKQEQVKTLTKINNLLSAAATSFTLLNKEKKGWQDKLDSMQHKLNAAERQVRCLDHLTRQKVESRQESGNGQPKRRGLLTSFPASADVIGAMCALNEKIYQTCVLFAEGLERMTVFPTKQKPQVQKVLGGHLTAMMEDQAKKVTSGYNKLLMRTVLEVFMTHWCSSIIEAFYPQQESFADLLVQLSAQTTNTAGKQINLLNYVFGAGCHSIIHRVGCHLWEADD